MADRSVPVGVDLKAWWSQNVEDGDHVHFPDRGSYPVDGFTVTAQWGVIVVGNGSVLDVAGPPVGKDHRRPFELIGCSGWQVWDLLVDGDLLPNEDARAVAAQHSFAIRGCSDMLLKRCVNIESRGDALYIGDFNGPSRDIVVCDFDTGRTLRHGITTIAAEGVVVNRPRLAAVGRTGFNFEVHQGQTVRTWACEDARFERGPLKVLTATGEGDAVGVRFDGISLPMDKHFDPTVFGEGAGALPDVPDRNYGKRQDWTIRRVRGAKPVVGSKVYARFVNVEGLTIEDVPTYYPIDSQGSTDAAGSVLR